MTCPIVPRYRTSVAVKPAIRVRRSSFETVNIFSSCTNSDVQIYESIFSTHIITGRVASLEARVVG